VTPRPNDLLVYRPEGLYCPPAGVYIDPLRAVDRALITHGHSDHARWGHRSYLCTAQALPAIRSRLGDINAQTVRFGETTVINGVRFSFHPAGHIPGSAQIRVEHQGQVWVASGDYKLEDDGLSEPFEPVRCDVFITESTFGLPVYQWRPQGEVFAEINAWWRENREQGKVSLLSCYSLGKAQRILRHLDTGIGPIYAHTATETLNQVLRKQGYALPDAQRVTSDSGGKMYAGSLVLAPPATLDSSWARRFKSVSVGVTSGWMAMRGTRRRETVDRGFILSDHADWPGLNEAVKATGAGRVLVTHGYAETFAKWLCEQGLDAEAAGAHFQREES
jgi:putative mRNA 3-end processing factor